MGASLALAGVGACTRFPDEKILPYVQPPEEVVPGRPLYFATADVQGGYARGTLVESVVAGFGVNLRRAALPPELADKAVSLEEAGATDLDRMRLLDDVRTRMAARLDDYERGGLATVLPDLRARDAARGRRVRGESATGIVSGIARGIADDGRLEVETEAGLVLVAAGEIVFEPAT